MNWKYWLIGSLKSWTMYLGALVVALPAWWPEVEPMVREWVAPENYPKLASVIGIAIVLLRIKTTDALVDKA